MTAGEFVRPVKLDRLPAGTLRIEADASERAALAQRFDLPGIHAFSADLTFEQAGDVIDMRGILTTTYEQRCALSDEPFAAEMSETIAIRFVPTLAIPGEEDEIEFASDAPDEIEYSGMALDVGEAVAQSFGLAFDPYALGPQAEAARREGGVIDADAPSGPFAALAALKAT